MRESHGFACGIGKPAAFASALAARWSSARRVCAAVLMRPSIVCNVGIGCKQEIRCALAEGRTQAKPRPGGTRAKCDSTVAFELRHLWAQLLAPVAQPGSFRRGGLEGKVRLRVRRRR